MECLVPGPWSLNGHRCADLLRGNIMVVSLKHSPFSGTLSAGKLDASWFTCHPDCTCDYADRSQPAVTATVNASQHRFRESFALGRTVTICQSTRWAILLCFEGITPSTGASLYPVYGFTYGESDIPLRLPMVCLKELVYMIGATIKHALAPARSLSAIDGYMSLTLWDSQH